MPKLSERLAKSGVNLLVIIIAIVVFIAAFVVLMAVSNASKPETIDILAASRTLNIGEPIASNDLVTITVYKDQLANMTIPSDQADQVVGGYAALPISAGQPILRDAIIASAGMGTRLSAILSKYPGYSLFPLPLDAPNVVAADSASYVPGDLVSITVVIASRPQPPVTPTPIYDGEYGYVITPTPVPPAQSAESTLDKALERSYPPMSKNLFPQGVQVIAIQGLPVQTVSQTDPSSSTADSSNISYTDYNQPKRLVLLVPSKSLEALSLGLQSGDMLIVSMVTEGQVETTAGFTYWDFEEMFRLERESVLK
jgi:hypothetical protein